MFNKRKNIILKSLIFLILSLGFINSNSFAQNNPESDDYLKKEIFICKK